jgi:hypothetical protein
MPTPDWIGKKAVVNHQQDATQPGLGLQRRRMLSENLGLNYTEANVR